MSSPVFQNAQVIAGIGKETIYGTGVVPAYYLPWLSMAADDVNGVVPDAAWRGAPGDAYGYVPGPLSGATPLGGNVHADTIGFPLAGLLGDCVAAGSGPVTWTMAVLNTGTQQPPSYTLTTVDGVNPRQWPGVKFSSLQLSASVSGTLDWSAEAVSLASVIVSAPTASYTTVPMIPSWRGAIQLGGSTVSNVIDSQVTITRVVDAKRNTDGTQAPYLQRSGLCTVAGTLTLLQQVDTYRAQYVAGTPTSIDLNYQQGAGATLTQTRVHCSAITLTDVQPDYTTGNYQLVNIAWSASYNATDAGASGGTSPVKVTLKNAVASGVYA